MKHQRAEHAALRKKLKHKYGNGGGRDSGGTSHIDKLKRKVENQRYHIASLHAKANGGGDGDKSVDSDSDGEEEGTSNMVHPALSRHNNKKGKVGFI